MRRLFFILYLFVATWSLIEVSLHFVYPLFPEPQRSLFEEMARVSLSMPRSFRNTRFELPPRRDVPVVIVGDSIPFGQLTSADRTFGARLGALSGLDVVTLALPGSAPVHYNRFMEAACLYHPRVIFYSIFANDFDYDEAPEARPLRCLSEADLVDSPSELFYAHPNLRQRIEPYYAKLVFSLFTRRIPKLFLGQAPVDPYPHHPWRHGDDYYSFVDKAFWDELVSWRSPRVRQSTESNERLIARAKALADEMGAKLVVTFIPGKEAVYAPLYPNPKEIFDESHLETYLHLQEKLTARKIAWLDLTAPLREAAKLGKKLYFSIDGHLTEAGHDVVAARLSAYLRDNLALTVRK